MYPFVCSKQIHSIWIWNRVFLRAPKVTQSKCTPHIILCILHILSEPQTHRNLSNSYFILLTNCFLLYATLILHLFLSSITFTNIIWMWQCCKHEGRRDKDGKIHANSWKKCFPPTHTYTHNHAHRQTNCIGQKRRKKNKIFSLDVRVVCVCGSPIYQRSNIAFHGQFGCDFAVCIVPYGREVLCTVRMTKIK